MISEILSNKIRNANVLLSMLIVLMHCTWADSRFSWLLTVTDVAVPTFFCISSFLYFSKFEFSWACYIQKIKNRIFSLLIPLIVYNSLTYAYYSVTVANNLWNNKLPPPPIYQLGNVIKYIWNSEGDPPLWFLSSLFLFCLFAPAVGLLISRSRISIIFVPLCAMFTYSLPYNNILFWLPCLFLGAWGAFYGDCLKQWEIKMPKGGCFFIALVVLLIFCFVFTEITDRSHDTLYYAYRMIAPLLVALIYVDFDVVPKGISKKLAPMCFYIYGTHFIIKEVVCIPFSDFPSELWLVKYACVVIIVMTIILISGKMLQKSSIIYKFLTGFR